MAKSEVAAWYKGQHIFLTGGTGFMGMVLVEKLLRSCSDLAALYILIRPKKGKSPQERIEKLLEDDLFDTIRSLDNSDALFKKVQVIEGDTTEENCGVSENVIQSLRKVVTLVIHSAANVRFDLSLKAAFNFNVIGTRNILDLACKFDELKTFIHISTAYCHCDQPVLEEKVYKAPHNPRKMIDLVSWLDDDALKLLTPHLIGELPNTYAYTKCIAEELVAEYQDKLPLVIARPSVVMSIYKEPIAGWINNINGPTGVYVGASKGILRTMHGHGDLMADLIPVDILDNSVLLIAWKSGTEQRKNKNGIQVYNVTCNEKNLQSWGYFVRTCKKLIEKYPSSQMLWHPGGYFSSSIITYEIKAFFLHMLPAYIIDLLLSLTGRKPFMVNVQKRIRGGLQMLSYYTTRCWQFKNDKLHDVYNTLNETDKNIFYTDREQIDWKYFMDVYIRNARFYALKENPDTIPMAQKTWRRLYYLDLFVKITFWFLLMVAFYHFIVLKFI